jgi:hypothetical protein
MVLHGRRGRGRPRAWGRVFPAAARGFAAPRGTASGVVGRGFLPAARKPPSRPLRMRGGQHRPGGVRDPPTHSRREERSRAGPSFLGTGEDRRGGPRPRRWWIEAGGLGKGSRPGREDEPPGDRGSEAGGRRLGRWDEPAAVGKKKT